MNVTMSEPWQHLLRKSQWFWYNLNYRVQEFVLATPTLDSFSAGTKRKVIFLSSITPVVELHWSSFWCQLIQLTLNLTMIDGLNPNWSISGSRRGEPVSEGTLAVYFWIFPVYKNMLMISKLSNFSALQFVQLH